MKPSGTARYAAAVTLSKGKMFEFGVPEDLHLKIPEGLDLALQFPLALGTIGEFAAETIDEAVHHRRRTTPLDEVLFAAQVLVATVDSKIAASIAGVVRLVAAAAFFLANSPGRAAAHCKNLPPSSFDHDDTFARALLTSLTQPWTAIRVHRELPDHAVDLLMELNAHYSGRSDKASIAAYAARLRQWVYAYGDAHQLLLSDLLCAVAIQRANDSAWSRLPEYTGLEIDVWAPYLLRPEAIKDMWPSQQMLGQSGVYAGKSAVVQMPTSAGKTRATELILRAALRSARTSLAIVVAPFRALCYEIAQDLRLKFRADALQINQLSDALQQDYKLDLREFLAFGFSTAPHVVVLTPEKLLYVMRQEPEFVSNVGLVVYDEGHQFDDSGRGVAYELLLTSIKRALPTTAQTVLISAVISNAQALASWLLSDQEKVVSDPSVQTSRHVAFTTMERGASGQLKFDSIIEGEQAFFVPRLISHHRLLGRGIKEFPTKESGSIALYLGIKLLDKGGVAIFVGKPESASKIIRDAVTKIFPRSTDIVFPSNNANPKELAALVLLYTGHFGEESFLTHGARHGIFAHTGDTPQGIRLAVEHAMRESLVSLVVCTSTLAQGVNLPIRYLLVTSPYQNGVLLKTRDFQNLAGRAGRAGMYGEGTIIFTDPKLFDRDQKNSRKWAEIQSLLKPEKSAPTTSALLRLVWKLHNRYRTLVLAAIEPVTIVEALLAGNDRIYTEAATQVGRTRPGQLFSEREVFAQLEEKKRTISSIQTFLMSQEDSFAAGNEVDGVRNLLRETYAYHLASNEEKPVLEWAFLQIWNAIEATGLTPEVRARYGRSLLGLNLSQEVDAWVKKNFFELQLTESTEDLLSTVWEFIDSSTLTEKLRRLEPPVARRELAKKWIEGIPFHELQLAVGAADGYIRHGKTKRPISQDALVGFCQNELAFQACLLLSAIAASYQAANRDVADDVVNHFEQLGKLLKYGLPNEEAAAVYEVGFADRVLAQKIAKLFLPSTSRQDVRVQLRRSAASINGLLENYPDYFGLVMTSATR